MAFTKAPVSDTHNTVRIPSTGSPFLVPQTVANPVFPLTLNYQDCYPLHQPMWGNDPMLVINKRGFFDDVDTAATAQTSINFTSWVLSSELLNTVFFGREDTLWKLANSSGTITITNTGTSAGIWATAATKAINASNVNVHVAVLGTQITTWNEDGSGFAVAAISPSINQLRNLVFLDGYLFAVGDDSKIYNSGPANALTTWNTTDFLSAEIYPDIPQFLIKHHNYLVVVGSNSTEFFYDAAIEVGSPLARQETYASRIGGVLPSVEPRKNVAYIEDTAYFIGQSEQQTYFLAEIKDFKVSEIDSSSMQAILNNINNIHPSGPIASIESIIVDNNPMVLIKLVESGGSGQGLVYFPAEKTWWTMILGDFGGVVGVTGSNSVASIFLNDFWLQNGVRSPFFLTCASFRAATSVTINSVDNDEAVSSSATITTAPMDFGIDFYKHIAQVRAIGNYGRNTLSLELCPNQTYTPFTSITPHRTPSTDGAGQDISWWPNAPIRRMVLRFSMTGYGGAQHAGFDITYNVGAA